MKTVADLQNILKNARARLAKKQAKQILDRLARVARRGKNSIVVNADTLLDETAELIGNTTGLFIEYDNTNRPRYSIGFC